MILTIQSLIHRLELGGGLRLLRSILLGVLLLFLIITYNFRGFKDFSNPETMDAAQIARNLAEHRGFTTLFIRPLSIHLLEEAGNSKLGPIVLPDLTDRGRLYKKFPHPDLANPPVYPVLLAGLMKVFPGMRHQNSTHTAKFWTYGGSFWIYPPDFWISFFNQLIFFGIAIFIFFIARKLFDGTVAWTSAALFLATDLFWRFSISGLPTMLLMLIFLTLTWTLMRFEEVAQLPPPTMSRRVFFALLAGVITGIGFLTRYSFGMLIIPVILFFVFYGRENWVLLCLLACASFCIVAAPWLARNYHLSHNLFGTAGYSIFETTGNFPEYRLQRSLEPAFQPGIWIQLWAKFIGNSSAILQEDVPKLCGSWLTAFFLVGFCLIFRKQVLNRVRVFVLMTMPILVGTQALIHTQLSDDSPVINSENLIVLVAPLVIIYGVSLFYMLVDQMNLPLPQFRFLVVALFCALIALPAFCSLIAPRTKAISYPPYFPPVIQKISGWMNPDELMMSDIPWAVAWYGERECLWLTLNAQNDFFAIDDYRSKHIKAVYLTPVTMDSRFLSQWVRTGERSWGSFAIESILKRELPPYFPLKRAPAGFLPEQLFLTDIERWNRKSTEP